MQITTINEAVKFLVEEYSDIYKEHRFEKISNCAESIMKYETPNTIFRRDDGSWIRDEYCDHFVNLIKAITIQWDAREHEERSST
jgi:hypothetical protein